MLICHLEFQMIFLFGRCNTSRRKKSTSQKCRHAAVSVDISAVYAKGGVLFIVKKEIKNILAKPTVYFTRKKTVFCARACNLHLCIKGVGNELFKPLTAKFIFGFKGHTAVRKAAEKQHCTVTFRSLAAILFIFNGAKLFFDPSRETQFVHFLPLVMSRCIVAALIPFSPRWRQRASASVTERCFPPVHPTATTRELFPSSP